MLEKQKYLEKINGEIEIFKKNEMLTKQKYLKEMEMEKQKYKKKPPYCWRNRNVIKKPKCLEKK